MDAGMELRKIKKQVGRSAFEMTDGLTPKEKCRHKTDTDAWFWPVC